MKLAMLYVKDFKDDGTHVFHGSANEELQELKPYQATYVNEEGEIIPDGEPAVAATPYIQIAVFRALVNKQTLPFPHSSGFDAYQDGTTSFKVDSEKTLNEARSGKEGCVYVLEKKKFTPYSRDAQADEDSMEWRSSRPVKPVGILRVTSDDLPESIVISH